MILDVCYGNPFIKCLKKAMSKIFRVILYGLLGAIAGACVGALVAPFLFIALLVPFLLLKLIIENLNFEVFYYSIFIVSIGICQIIGLSVGIVQGFL